MQFSLKALREYLQTLWTRLSKQQKTVLIVAPLVAIVALASLIIWANRPVYEPLFTGLSAADAGAITQKLTDLKVNYQLADNGATILVPKQQAAAARLNLANAGIPQGSKFSFNYLNQMQLGESDADQKLRFILGLQDEMETTLKTMTGVQDARVSITEPDPSLYTDSQEPSTASVTLQLVPGVQLTSEQVKAIANLLAASIQGLQPSNVTIVDTNGNLLSASLNDSSDPQQLTGDQMQIQQTMEDGLDKSVQTMLEQVFGVGNIVVRSNVDLDFDQVKITQQQNTPGALVSRQSSTETEGTAPQTVASSGQTYVTPSSSSSTQVTSSSTVTENYQVNTYNEQRTVNPGAIKRLTISVMADSSNMSTAQVNQIKSLVASAVGYNQSRGDQIQVVAMPFDKSNVQKQQLAMAAEQKKQTTQTFIELGVGVVVGLILLLIVIMRWRNRNRVFDMGFEPVPIAAAEDMLVAQKPKAVMERPLDKSEKQKAINESVDEFSRNNPEEVAKLVKTWLSEEK